MKKTLSLVLAALMLVVLGCSLGGLGTKEEPAPTPVADKPDTGDSTSTDKPESTSSGGSAAVNYENFSKLKFDMSYDEAKGVMGGDGNETSSSKSGSYESKSYQWKDGRKSVRARFRNGKLASRSQTGLTDSDGKADISQAKFNEVKTGMSYDEAKKILGEGELVSESRIASTTLTSYIWKGPKYSSIRASFKNDELSNKYQSGLK
ncbi:MAG: DUF3862 domain-containing protein [Pyrinomonadaceae bacterium]|nr:DUF3862 domain-containing protein [Pyrinomonadaceae bacterium]